MKILNFTYFLAFLSLVLVSCGSPQNELNKVIEQKKFIPFALPMDSTRVGTLLRGNAFEMYTVARPEKCFPDLSAQESLRWVQETDLPNQYRKVEIGFNAEADIAINSGNNLIHFKTESKLVKTVEIEFTGAQVEYLDESNFLDFYNSDQISTSCKSLLHKNAFIGQALRIKSMNFTFKNEFGTAVDLKGQVSQIVNISAGVNWSIVNNYTLKIETPKYIGYRMARLDSNQNIKYASSVDSSGQWIFKDVNRSVKTQSPSSKKIFRAESLK